MQEEEPEMVAQILSQPPLNLPMKVVNSQERFLSEMKELRDPKMLKKSGKNSGKSSTGS